MRLCDISHTRNSFVVRQGVSETIDKTVEEQVETLLSQHMPDDMMQELHRSQEELAELQKQLHNSSVESKLWHSSLGITPSLECCRESRRANATLVKRRNEEKLHTLYNIHGKISQNFPKTLEDLIALTGGFPRPITL